MIFTSARWLVLIGMFAFTACRSTEPTETVKDLSEADQIPLRVGGEEETDVPNFLWSPTKRKSSAGYFYLVAEYKSLAGDAKSAQSLFESAYNLDPNPFLAAKLIAAEASSGQTEEAMSEARKMVLLYPKSSQLKFLYGSILSKRGFYKEAVEEYEEAIALDADNEEIYLELADLHQMNRETTKAITVIKDLISTLPHSARGWSRLARFYLINGQKKQALAPAQKAYDMRSSDPESTLIYALALEANEQSAKAVALYENLYRLNPSNEELIERMIEIYRSLGNLEQSLELLNELAKLPGGVRPGVQLQRAIIMWELNRFEDAARILLSIAEEFPEHMRLKYLAGVGQERIKAQAKALEWYAKIPVDSEFWPSAQLRTAIIFKDMKRDDEALQTFLDLEKSGKGDPDTYIFGASLYADKKDFKSAIDLVTRGYEKHADQHRFLFLKGVYQERAGDIQGCIASMRRMIDLDGSNSAAMNFLGYIYAERGEHLDEAERLIERALKLKPNDGYYLDSLAWVYYQKKNYKKALETLLQAHTIIPDEGVVHEHLGDVYLKLGDKSKALAAFEKALKQKLEDKEKARVEGKVKSLRSELKAKALK